MTFCEHCGSAEEQAHIKYYDKATGQPVHAIRCSSNPCKTPDCHHYVHIPPQPRIQRFLWWSWTAHTYAHVACSKCRDIKYYGMAGS